MSDQHQIVVATRRVWEPIVRARASQPGVRLRIVGYRWKDWSPVEGEDVLGGTFYAVHPAAGDGEAAAMNTVARGEIPVLRFGRRILVPVPALERLLEKGSGTVDGD